MAKRRTTGWRGTGSVRAKGEEWEMRVAAESTRAEAMKKARKYIKPGHRRIRKVGNVYEVWAVESGSF